MKINRLNGLYYDDGSNPIKKFKDFLEKKDNFLILFATDEQIFGFFSEDPLSK